MTVFHGFKHKQDKINPKLAMYIEPDLKIIKKFVKNCVENLVINL